MNYYEIVDAVHGGIHDFIISYSIEPNTLFIHYEDYRTIMDYVGKNGFLAVPEVGRLTKTFYGLNVLTTQAATEGAPKVALLVSDPCKKEEV